MSYPGYPMYQPLGLPNMSLPGQFQPIRPNMIQGPSTSPSVSNAAGMAGTGFQAFGMAKQMGLFGSKAPPPGLGASGVALPLTADNSGALGALGGVDASTIGSMAGGFAPAASAAAPAAASAPGAAASGGILGSGAGAGLAAFGPYGVGAAILLSMLANRK